MVALGDLDGDGVGDLAVGAYGDDDGAGDTGAVHVLFLEADVSVRALAKISRSTVPALGLRAGDCFGFSEHSAFATAGMRVKPVAGF